MDLEPLSRAAYQQMRLTILLTWTPDEDHQVFSNAYYFAWDDEVYPYLHEGADWHKPHRDQFRVGEELQTELLRFLADIWDRKQTISFYELESHYGIHGAAHSDGDWERYTLISACRYLFLNNSFDKSFWAALCRNGECPAEALSIADPKPDKHLLQ